MAVFCSDIDGTLLNPERTISERTIRAIRAVRALGHSFILCSSRMPASMRILEQLYDGTNEPLIAYNGGLVLSASGDVVHNVTIEPDDAIAVFGLCESLDTHGSFFAGENWFIWDEDFWSAREINNTGVHPRPERSRYYIESDIVQNEPPHKIMCMGEETLIDEIETKLSGNARMVTYRSKPTYLEIASANCSKGAGVQAIIEGMGVDARDAYFFGDNFNDLSAFAVVGTSIAVANANEPVLSAASVRTARHHDDGVAIYLEDWMSAHA